MHNAKVSVIIPYCNRPDHLKIVLTALTEQDIDLERIEVIIASTERDPTLLEIVPAFSDTLRIRCAVEQQKWNVSRARNLGFSSANGDILLLLDSDMLLPRSFLSVLCSHYDLIHDDVAVICQMLGYNAHSDVESYVLSGYEEYRDLYLSRNSRQGLPEDQRWTSAKNIPWCMCWSALIAIPRRLIERHELYFDQTFIGWGAEDLEWGYRLSRCNIDFVFADELWGIHLPHLRNVQLNLAQQEANYERFLTKWPCFDVELVTRFGDGVANSRYKEFTGILESVRGIAASVNVLEVSEGDARHLVVGAVADAEGRILNMDEIAVLASRPVVRRFPLLGLRLPYSDEYAHSAYLMKPLRNAPDVLQGIISSEARRVSKQAIRLY